MSKSTISLLGLGVVALSWVVTRIRKSFRNSAPVGYEDEAGFHFGPPLEK
jgi:hypothetical protein